MFTEQNHKTDNDENVNSTSTKVN